MHYLLIVSAYVNMDIIYFKTTEILGCPESRADVKGKLKRRKFKF